MSRFEHPKYLHSPSQADHYLERSQAPPLLRVAAAVVRPEGVPGADPGVPARPHHHPRQDAGRGGKIELQMNLREDYAKFYNHGERPSPG